MSDSESETGDDRVMIITDESSNGGPKEWIVEIELEIDPGGIQSRVPFSSSGHGGGCKSSIGGDGEQRSSWKRSGDGAASGGRADQRQQSGGGRSSPGGSKQTQRSGKKILGKSRFNRSSGGGGGFNDFNLQKGIRVIFWVE